VTYFGIFLSKDLVKELFRVLNHGANVLYKCGDLNSQVLPFFALPRRQSIAFCDVFTEEHGKVFPVHGISPQNITFSIVLLVVLTFHYHCVFCDV